MQENTIFTLLFKKKESYVSDQQQRISCQYRKSEQAFYAKIDHSIKQAEEGKVFRQHEGESIGDFVDRLLVLSTYGHYI